LSQFVQVGWLVTPEPIKPQLSRINPLKGFKRIYGKRGLVKAVINTLKLVLLTIVSILVIRAQIDTVATLPKLAAPAAAIAVLRLVLIIAFILIVVLLALAVFDVLYQRWQHNEDNKMT